MKYKVDEIRDECLAQLREDIQKNKDYVYYDPCVVCENGGPCATCDYNICLRVLKELCSEDYCKFCVGRLKRPDGEIDCGYRCDDENRYNYFSCFDPNYLAILDDMIAGRQGGD